MDADNAFKNDATLEDDQMTSAPMSPSSQEMFVLRETHKYIFFGPSRKDVKNTYFEAVYLFEKKLRIQAGQKVILSHSKETYGVALVGQAQNRQVWVWLVSFQNEDVVKRLIVQVNEIVGTQTPEEQEICRNALARYQRKSHSYRAMLAAQEASLQSSSDSNSPLNSRRSLRSHIRPSFFDDVEPKAKRFKRPYGRRYYDSDDEVEDAFDEDDQMEEDEDVYSNRRISSPSGKSQLSRQNLEAGDLFLTLLECVVMTLQTEYPQSAQPITV